MPIHIFESGVHEQASRIFIGVDGESKRVKQGFLGVNNIPAMFHSNGEGTAEDPYMIWNEEDLRMIAAEPDACYALGNSITITQPWTTICGEEPFTGTLDGRGKAIYLKGYLTGEYLPVMTEEGYGFGLLGVNEGHIKNLDVIPEYIAAPSSSDAIGYGGGLVAYNKGVIERCTLSLNGNIQGRGKFVVGGLVGKNLGSGVIRDCSSRLVVTRSCSGEAGGLVGWNLGNVQRTYTYGYSLNLTSVGFTSFGFLCGTQEGVFRDSSGVYVFQNALSNYDISFSNCAFAYGHANISGVRQFTKAGLSNTGNFVNFDFAAVWYMLGSLGPMLHYTA